MKKYYIIINPRAGNKSVERVANQVFDAFRAESVYFDYAFTEQAGHASELARRAVSRKYDVVVAVGGDGTVNEVGRGLVGSDVSMGIVPIGSGNGLARDLKISTNLSKAIDILLKGRDKPVDVWKMNHRIFLCAAGVGFDSMVAGKMSQSKGRGKWEYIRLSLQEGLSYKPVNLSLMADGVLLDQAVFLTTFSNAAQFGNNAYISPGAKTDDGLLDVAIVRPFSKIFYPILGLSLFMGNIHRLKFYKRYRVRSVVIQKATTNLFHLDGESVEMEYPVEISRHQSQLKVRVA